MSIYSVNMRHNRNDELDKDDSMLIEFAVLESGKLILFTEEDVDISVRESTSIFLEGSRNYKPIKISYKGATYGVQVIPSEVFSGGHQGNRVKLFVGGAEAGARHIAYTDDDPICLRGALSIYQTTKGKSFKDRDVMNQNCIDAATGFVYHMIDDLEDYYNGEIDDETMQKKANEKYSALRQSKKEEYTKAGEKLRKKGPYGV